ncbi:phytoene/squalene synthase family protein [Rhodobacteraceae bacterium RKSG542]|uniref:phytoene/squalene synthase family protein n=1 Tax=Pseudovibrio flavus TaxID=2529854 RepID=UPI0012BCCC75|nr:phytoene/squalene synthase family protein [Pseudovibrio flavus]MTI15872.1 phytoene/squalene synthase family protein [Pseudovibrio flavus]
MSERTQENFEYCLEQLRKLDRDRYFSCLYAPESKRAALAALYAYQLELSRIPHQVKEALPGEIRLQWWVDALGGEGHGNVRDNPVADALLDAVEHYNLSSAALATMAEARRFDLYNDPMPSLNDLEGYCGETQSLLLQQAVTILVGPEEAPKFSDACGHGGVVHGMTGLLIALPWHIAGKQQFIPQDTMRRHGLDEVGLFSGKGSEALEKAAAEIRFHIDHHMEKMEAAFSGLPLEGTPAFLPVMLNKQYLKLLPEFDDGRLQPYEPMSDLSRQWHTWRASRALTKAFA